MSVPPMVAEHTTEVAEVVVSKPIVACGSVSSGRATRCMDQSRLCPVTGTVTAWGERQTAAIKVLADLVRTDRNHRPVAGDSPGADGIKVLARTHQNLIWEARHTNQVRMRGSARNLLGGRSRHRRCVGSGTHPQPALPCRTRRAQSRRPATQPR